MTAARRRILVVEDQAAIAISLEDTLLDAGYVIAGSFGSCALALTFLDRETPDIALLDMLLQDGSCEPVAAELARRNVPFVIFSGNYQSANALEGLPNAIWIEKPAPPEELLGALDALTAAGQPKRS